MPWRRCTAAVARFLVVPARLPAMPAMPATAPVPQAAFRPTVGKAQSFRASPAAARSGSADQKVSILATRKPT